MVRRPGAEQPAGSLADLHRFDVFISYSRRDAPFARRLQRALSSYAPPSDLPVPHRRLRVFRDESDFQGTEYEAALGATLRSAANLLVVCSPSSRASRFVGGEIAAFAALRGQAHIVSVLIDGIPNNESPGADERKAFHEELVARLPVPLAADYRGWNEQRDRVDRDRFEGAWYKLLADIYAEYGVDRSGIEQREKLRRRRTRRIWTGFMSALTLVLASLTVWALISRREAIAQRNTAQSRFLASQSMSGAHPYDVALLLAVAAHRTTASFEAWEALFLGLQRQPAVRGFLHGVDTPVRRIFAGRAGTCAAAVTEGGKTLVWDLQTGQRRFEIAGSALPDHACRSLVIVSDSGEVEARPIDQLQPRRWAVTDGPGPVSAWTIDPADKTVALAHTGGRLLLRDLEDGRIRFELSNPGAALTHLRFSADGQALAGIDTGGMVHRWQIGSGPAVPVSPAVRCVTNPEVVSISRDLRWCAAGGPGQLVLADLSGTDVKPIDLGTPWILALDFSPDGRTLMAGVQGGDLQFWNLEQALTDAGKGRPASWSEHRADVTAAAYAADGGAIVSAARDRSLIVWQPAPPSRLVSEVARTAERSVAAADAGATRIAIGTPGGELMVSAVGPGSLAAAAPLANLGKPVTAVALRSSGEIFAGSADGDVQGVTGPGQRRVFPTGHRAPIVRIRFNHDESRAAVVAENGVVTISDVASGRLLATFPGGRPRDGRGGGITPAVDAAFEPGGTRLVSVHADQQAFLWQWTGETARWSPLPFKPASYFSSAAFGSDGRTVALGTGIYGGEIVLIDAANPGAAVTRLPGHDLQDVTGLAFSPDRRLLFSGGFDATVMVWDVAGRRRIGEVHRTPGSISDIAYAADGSAVIAVAGRGVVLRWDMAPEHWVALACRIANRELSTEERTRFSADAAGRTGCR